MPYFLEMSERQTPFIDLKLENCELSCNGVTELLLALSTFKKPLNALSIGENELGWLVWIHFNSLSLMHLLSHVLFWLFCPPAKWGYLWGNFCVQVFNPLMLKTLDLVHLAFLMHAKKLWKSWSWLVSI